MARTRLSCAGPVARVWPYRSLSTWGEGRSCRSAMATRRTSTSTRPSRRSKACRTCAWRVTSPTAPGRAGRASGRRSSATRPRRRSMPAAAPCCSRHGSRRRLWPTATRSRRMGGAGNGRSTWRRLRNDGLSPRLSPRSRRRPVRLRSATSANTRRLLVEHGGFLYDSNAYDDDLPYVETVAGRTHVVLPYAFDTNDMRFCNGGGFVFADDFARYCIDAFDRLYNEGAAVPRMLSVGLHLRIIGRPARIGGLERFLDHAASGPVFCFAPRDETAHALRAGIGLPPWSPLPAMSSFGG